MVKVKKWEERGGRAVLPLPSRQEIEAHHPEAILHAADLERIHAKLKRRDKNGVDGRKDVYGREVDIDFEAAPIVSTSYCWEDIDLPDEGVDLPDADARTLRKLAAALQGTWSGAA